MMETPSNYVCRGCQRPEMHKMCPAWGTQFYMSGVLFTPEMEIEFKEIRDEAIAAFRRGDYLTTEEYLDSIAVEAQKCNQDQQ